MDAELLRANLVRTLVPLIVGALASLLPIKGVEQFSTLVGFGVSAGYYAIFRVLETRFPWVGLFLGKRMPKDTRLSSRQSAHHVTSATPETVSVKVGGVDIPGVESLTWDSGETPVLTLRIRDPQVEFVRPGSQGPAAARRPLAVPAPRKSPKVR